MLHIKELIVSESEYFESRPTVRAARMFLVVTVHVLDALYTKSMLAGEHTRLNHKAHADGAVFLYRLWPRILSFGNWQRNLFWLEPVF